MDKLIKSAFLKRKGKFSPDTDSYRIFDGVGDGLKNAFIDNFSGNWLVSYNEKIPFLNFDDALPKKSIWIKELKHEGKTSPKCIFGDPISSNFVINENKVLFEIDFSAGYSQGLFLDQRDNRSRIMKTSKGKMVLNCFSYTCGFSVAAALGGAKSTTSIDLSRSYLEWGKRNFLLNNINISDHFFCRGDVFRWLNQFKQKDRSFDTVILDPPSFSRDGKKGSFSVVNDYTHLIELAVKLVNPSGWVLACTNHRKLKSEDFINSITLGVNSAKRKILDMYSMPMPFDFNGENYLKSIWVQVS